MPEFNVETLKTIIDNIDDDNVLEQHLTTIKHDTENVSIGVKTANEVVTYCMDVIDEHGLMEKLISDMANPDSVARIAGVQAAINIILNYVSPEDAPNVDLYLVKGFVDRYFNRPVPEHFTSFHNYNALLET